MTCGKGPYFTYHPWKPNLRKIFCLSIYRIYWNFFLENSMYFHIMLFRPTHHHRKKRG